MELNGNKNGIIVLKALAHLGFQGTVEEVIDECAAILETTYHEIEYTVSETLRGGVKFGYIEMLDGPTGTRYKITQQQYQELVVNDTPDIQQCSPIPGGSRKRSRPTSARRGKPKFTSRKPRGMSARRGHSKSRKRG